MGKGLCECGCGGKTNLQPYNDASRDWVEGRPQRFISGHNGRLNRNTYRVKKSGCWIWQGTPSSVGYGKAWRNGKTLVAHRYIYEQMRGPIKKGLHLDHLCRVTMCVNPDHLEPVTVAENRRRGIGMKLAVSLVRDLRARLASAKRGDQVRLARQFHISQSHLSQIKHGRHWAEVKTGGTR